MPFDFSIQDYDAQYKDALMDISLPWLEGNDLLEPADIDQLTHPERVLAAGGRIFLAMAEGKPVGMMMLEPFGNGVAEPFKFGVLEAYRNHGIGKASWRPPLTPPGPWGSTPWSSPPTTA